MNKNQLKILTAGILSTVLLGVSTPAIALETSKTATQSTEADQPVSVSNTQYDAPWGLDRIDQRSNHFDGTFTTEANAGKGVSIYIVDSGILSTHDDFTGRVDEGWSIVEGNDTSACNYHGTHVAGIAAGTKYGVAKSATIIPVRIFDSECSDNHAEGLIAGLQWIKDHHQAGNPAVVNLSVEADGGNENIDNAVKALIDDGITVVAGAGNSIKDACNYSPARVPEVITVAASNSTDRPWVDTTQSEKGSNWGRCVDIYAPGQNILSAIPDSDTAEEAVSGTSMASPHVAGAAAVILSRNPLMTPAQVASEIMNTSTRDIFISLPPETPNRLLFLSATTATTAPSAPTNVVASLGSPADYFDIQWTHGDNGGSALTRQELIIYKDGTRAAVHEMHPEQTNTTFYPSSKEGTFTFTLIATNAIGTSPESAQSNPVTIPSADATAPSAPTNVVASLGHYTGGDHVQWTPSNDNGSPIIDQTIFIYENGVKISKSYNPGDLNEIVFYHLSKGKTYTFSVVSRNAIGTSPESAQSNPITIPSEPTTPTAPSNVTATPFVGGATINWVQGADNGNALTSQTVKAYDGDLLAKSIDVSGTDTTINMGELEQGKTYTFTVSATNEIGTSPESTRSALTTIPRDVNVPDAPTNTRAYVSTKAGAANVYWDAASDGGSALTSYEITVYDGTNVVKTVKAPASYKGVVVTGLYNGTNYHFTVKAVNSVGTSPESNATNTINPIAAAPDAPTNPRAYARTGSADVFWDTPAHNGSAINSYVITVYDGTNVVKTVKAPASYKGVVVTGLYNGTNYHFTVKAVNSVGTSPESNATNTINPIAAAPGNATNVRAVAGDNNATIYWTRGNENGAPLTSQIVTVYSGTTKIGTVTISGSYSSLRMTGLTEGREYQFTITEVNKMGSSPESAKSNIVTPI